jgi:F-type H+-transporting ATPase subunit delta
VVTPVRNEKNQWGRGSVASQTKSSDTLAGRYAAALFDLAEERGALDAVAGDLKRLRAMIDGSKDLQRMIRSPIIDRRDQARAIAAVAGKAELSELVQHFLGVLAHNRRLFALPDMIQAYLDILAGERGEVTARVVSARKLTERQLKSLTDSLRAAMGSAVAVDASVDASLLGGLVVRVGSRMVDSSLKTKLQHLRLAMKGIG